MSTQRARKHRQVARLFQEQGGNCFWCREPMILVDNRGKQAKEYPEEMATIDHLRDKFHPLRLAPCNGEKRRVLAHKACNQQRGRESVQMNFGEHFRRTRGHSGTVS